MKKFLLPFALLLSVFMLFSCESKRAENGDLLFGLDDVPVTGGGGTSGNTKLLSKVTAVDDEGLLTTITYTYTAGKLTAAKYVSEESTEEFTLIYDGTTLTKLNVKKDDGVDVLTSYLDLTYDSGRLVSASGKMEAEGSTELMRNETVFSYNPAGKTNKIVTFLKSEDPDNPGQYINVNSLTSDLQYSGDNISYWKLSMETFMSGPIVIPPMIVEINLSNYDTQKNPFATLPQAFTLAGAHFNSSTNSINGLSKYNYKSVTAVTMGVSQNFTVTYAYDSDGYPVKSTGSDGSVINFEYIIP